MVRFQWSVGFTALGTLIPISPQNFRPGFSPLNPLGRDVDYPRVQKRDFGFWYAGWFQHRQVGVFWSPAKVPPNGNVSHSGQKDSLARCSYGGEIPAVSSLLGL